MNNSFLVDRDLCVSCGKCVEECGNHVQIQGGGHVDPNNPLCSGCLHCYTVCPKSAIKLTKTGNGIPQLEERQTITAANLESFLAYRRSIRSFTGKDVSDDIVQKLIDRARYIPSGGNAHSYEFTVLKSTAIKAKIRDELIHIYDFRSHLLNNPVLRNLAKPFVNKQMRGFLKDKNYGNRMKDLMKRIKDGDDPFFYRAPVIIVIHSRAQIPTPKEDCVLAGYNICLMAQALGHGTCYVTMAQNAFNSSNKCKALMGLDSEDNVNAVVILGYPAVQHKRIAPKIEKQINWY